MRPYEYICALESTNSRNEKEEILAALAKDLDSNNEFFEGLLLALNPYWNFHIKQIAEEGLGEDLSFEDFQKGASQLISREVTGNDARDLIEEMRQKAGSSQWRHWYRRILLKDLRCGVTEKTVNKVLSKVGNNSFKVPTFDCQLAHDHTDHGKKMTGEKLIEVKLDGVRAIVIFTEHTCTVYSRSGKLLSNFAHISQAISNLPGLADYIKANNLDGLVFDGEIMSASFQDLMKQLYRKEHVDATDSVYHMFDVVPLADFIAGRCLNPLTERIAILKSLTRDGESCLQTLEHEIVNLDTEEGQERLIEIRQAATDAHYEGIMLKDPNSPYECKRSTSWLKMKPYIDVSLMIRSYEEGTNKYTGKLGAFWCEGDENGKHIGVSVGGGYTDEQREKFWNSRDELIGHIIEVRADAITQNQDGSFSLRFPRFLKFRGREAYEKL